MSFRLIRSDAWLTSDVIAGETGLATSVMSAQHDSLKPYLSIIVLTSSKQVSWRSWAAISSSCGSVGMRCVIRLSMAVVMRSGAIFAS